MKENLVKVFLGAVILLGVPLSAHADFSIGIGIGDKDRDHREDRYRHEDHDRFRDDGHHFYRWHDRPHYGYRFHFLPEGYFSVWAGGVLYYYYDGLYYVRDGYEYVLVQPPVGVYVNSIPADFHAVNIGGRIYYTDGGVYYLLTEHHGYKVVPAPVVYERAPEPVVVVPSAPMQEPVVVANAPAVVEAQDVFPVNVPNSSGGYTKVMIKKSGNGFVGPQGELYTTFPTVAQLKAMYTK